MEKVLVVDGKKIDEFMKRAKEEKLTNKDFFRTVNKFEFEIRKIAESVKQAKGRRQVIPYIFLENKGRIALFQRDNGKEKRLKHKYTIGIGGHINPEDAISEQGGETSKVNDLEFIVEKASFRELQEEISFAGIPCGVTSFFKFILMDNNEVDKVHFGLAYKMKIHTKKSHIKIETKDDEVSFVGFFTPQQLKKKMKYGFNFENWSKLLISSL